MPLRPDAFAKKAAKALTNQAMAILPPGALSMENEPDWNLPLVSLYSFPPQRVNPCFASEINPVRFAESHVSTFLPPNCAQQQVRRSLGEGGRFGEAVFHLSKNWFDYNRRGTPCPVELSTTDT